MALLTSLQQEYFNAAETGDLDKLKECIAQFRSPSEIGRESCYAFCTAADHGHLNIVKYLAEEYTEYIDVAAEDNFAFRYAAENQHLEILEYLYKECPQKESVDPSALDNFALEWAVKDGHTEVVDYLLKLDPLSVNFYMIGDESLIVAIESNKLETVQYLLENKLQPNRAMLSPSDKVVRYAGAALKAAHLEMFEIIYNNYEDIFRDDKDKSMSTTLFLTAAYTENLGVLKNIVERYQILPVSAVLESPQTDSAKVDTYIRSLSVLNEQQDFLKQKTLNKPREYQHVFTTSLISGALRRVVDLDLHTALDDKSISALLFPTKKVSANSTRF